jgi:hypothetical protein
VSGNEQSESDNCFGTSRLDATTNARLPGFLGTSTATPKGIRVTGADGPIGPVRNLSGLLRTLSPPRFLDHGTPAR